jgi:hypothetical protein
MSRTYTVHQTTVDGPIVGTYTDDAAGVAAGPRRGEIIDVDGKRWRVVADAEGEETLLVQSIDDFEGLDDVGMAGRHADETRDEEQDEADNVAGPSGPHVEPGPDDRYT